MPLVASEVQIKVDSLLRRAGLQKVPRPVLACLCAICAVLLVAALWQFWPSAQGADSFDYQAPKAQENGEIASSGDVAPSGQAADGKTDAGAESGAHAGSEAGSIGDASQKLMVDVEGAVVKPGLYELSSGARAGDAVNAAGGFSEQAQRTSVNLASRLEDGQQLYVMTKREAQAQVSGQTSASQEASASTSLAPSAAPGSGSLDSGSAASSKVNINSASLEQLQSLPGVGPVLAQSIIDYREGNGPFAKVEDIKNVSGIGDTRYQHLENQICV